MLLGASRTLRLCRCAKRLQMLRQVARSKEVDLFLVDLLLEGEDGFALLERLRRMEHPRAWLSWQPTLKSPSLLSCLVSLGVSGIIIQSRVRRAHYWKCIRSVASGEAWLEQNHLSGLLRELSKSHHKEAESELTDREKEVLRALLQGLSNKQIAERMNIRETAVKFLLQNLFRKTGVHARSQLVRIALERYRGELWT